MKQLLFVFATVILLPSCGDGNFNGQLLVPSVRKAKQFVDLIKQNDRDNALRLTYHYLDDVNLNPPGPSVAEYGKAYDEIFPVVYKNKLKPLKEWRTSTSVFGTDRFNVTFDEVFIPFDKEAKADTDPVLLYIGYKRGLSDDIFAFQIVYKNAFFGDSLKVRHVFSAKEEERLREDR